MELYLLLAGALGTVILGILYFRFGPDSMPRDIVSVSSGNGADTEQRQITAIENSMIAVGQMNTARKVLPVIFAVHLAEALFLANFYKSAGHDIFLLVSYLAVLWSVSYYDYRFHIIPNRILLAACIVRAVMFAFECVVYGFGNIVSLSVSLLIASGGLMLAAIICRLVSPQSVGFGDVKLLAVTGLYLGIDKVFGVILPSLVAMFFVAMYLLLFKKASRQTELPFAPFLLAGTVIGGILFGV